MDDKSYIRVPKTWVRTALIVAVTALIVAPLAAVASHSFTDVPNNNTFHADIEWLKDSGVTRGCNPPANTLFCPEDEVTRGQMAAFMNRFAQYIDAEDGTPGLADHATTAGDAHTVDGHHPSDFVGHGEIVTTVGGGDWTANSSSPPSVLDHWGGTTEVAQGAVVLGLQGPASFDGVEYGLQSFTYCIHHVASGAFVDRVAVLRGTSDIFLAVVSDDTNRSTAGCFTVDVGHSGDTYSVLVQVSGGTSLRVGGIEARWLPAAQLTSNVSSSSANDSSATGP